MKKLLSTLTILATLCCMVACGTNKQSDINKETAEVTSNNTTENKIENQSAYSEEASVCITESSNEEEISSKTENYQKDISKSFSLSFPEKEDEIQKGLYEVGDKYYVILPEEHAFIIGDRVDDITIEDFISECTSEGVYKVEENNGVYTLVYAESDTTVLEFLEDNNTIYIMHKSKDIDGILWYIDGVNYLVRTSSCKKIFDNYQEAFFASPLSKITEGRIDKISPKINTIVDIVENNVKEIMNTEDYDISIIESISERIEKLQCPDKIKGVWEPTSVSVFGEDTDSYALYKYGFIPELNVMIKFNIAETKDDLTHELMIRGADISEAVADGEWLMAKGNKIASYINAPCNIYWTELLDGRYLMFSPQESASVISYKSNSDLSNVLSGTIVKSDVYGIAEININASNENGGFTFNVNDDAPINYIMLDNEVFKKEEDANKYIEYVTKVLLEKGD